MTTEALFKGVHVHCVGHATKLVKKGDNKCDECKMRDEKLNIKPPFNVVCKNKHQIGIEEGDRVIVDVVVRNGESNTGMSKYGYLIRAEGGLLLNRLYDSDYFEVEKK